MRRLESYIHLALELYHSSDDTGLGPEKEWSLTEFCGIKGNKFHQGQDTELKPRRQFLDKVDKPPRKGKFARSMSATEKVSKNSRMNRKAIFLSRYDPAQLAKAYIRT